MIDERFRGILAVLVLFPLLLVGVGSLVMAFIAAYSQYPLCALGSLVYLVILAVWIVTEGCR